MLRRLAVSGQSDQGVLKFADVIYVLHCFQKKAEKTTKADIDLAAERYRYLLKELDK